MLLFEGESEEQPGSESTNDCIKSSLKYEITAPPTLVQCSMDYPPQMALPKPDEDCVMFSNAIALLQENEDGDPSALCEMSAFSNADDVVKSEKVSSSVKPCGHSQVL